MPGEAYFYPFYRYGDYVSIIIGALIIIFPFLYLIVPTEEKETEIEIEEAESETART